MSDPRYGFAGKLAEALQQTEAQTIDRKDPMTTTPNLKPLSDQDLKAEERDAWKRYEAAQAIASEAHTWWGYHHSEQVHRLAAKIRTAGLPSITCGQTMIGGPCDRVSLHEGDHENSLSRTLEDARRAFNI